MQIPPVGGSQPPYSNRSPDQEVVDKFGKLWDDWYNHPTRESGEALLKFLEEHRAQLAEIAKNNPNPPEPPPHGPPAFDHACDQAESYLKGWLSHGCDPQKISPPSEFIADTFAWVSYDK